MAEPNRAELTWTDAVLVVKAAQAFVEWYMKGQPKTPGSLYPFTYEQQEMWHLEYDKRLAALIEAVARLDP